LLNRGEMKLRASRYYKTVGRIKQGETIESAQAEMKAIAARLATSYPEDNQGRAKGHLVGQP
jgi:hypothetical protein